MRQSFANSFLDAKRSRRLVIRSALVTRMAELRSPGAALYMRCGRA